MGMEYTVFAGTIEIDEIKISTTRSVEDWKIFNDFKATLSQEERSLFSMVSEYQREAHYESLGEDFDPTDNPCGCDSEYGCPECNPAEFCDYEEEEDHWDCEEEEEATEEEKALTIKYYNFMGYSEE